jgi:serine protease inhibitor
VRPSGGPKGYTWGTDPRCHMRWPFATKRAPSLDGADRGECWSTDFALRLFKQLALESGDRNLVFSPASILLCLGMALEGATGETRDSIVEALSAEPEELRSTLGSLKSALEMKGPSLQLEAANSLWCDRRAMLGSEYVASMKQAYDAEVSVLDFNNTEAVAKINAWVAAKTRGKIERIVSFLDPLAILVLANAIYFKDLWEEPFLRDATRMEIFRTSRGSKLEVPLMTQSGSYLYYENSQLQVVRLPYNTPSLAMYVFLPSKRSSMSNFLLSLQSASWDNWIRNMEMTEGWLSLPRCKITCDTSLSKSLSKLGMEIAFDPERAQFDAICGPPARFWLSEIMHKAFVEINEEGTEAAATTAMEACGASPRRTPFFTMIVDRPFFFAICDVTTKAILLMGSVEEPQA